MTQEEFLQELQDLLRTDVTLTFDTPLDELDEWDSTAMLAVISFSEDDFGISLDVNDFIGFKTPGDIYKRLTVHGN